MTLKAAPTLAGRTFTIRGEAGVSVVVSVDEDGSLSQEVMTQTSRDEHGNLLEMVEIDRSEIGEPPLQFFAFPDLEADADSEDVPMDNRPFAVEVEGRLVVPVRYVRGVHMEKETVELSEELEDLLISQGGMPHLIRKEADTDAEAVNEDEAATEVQGSEVEADEADEAEEE